MAGNVLVLAERRDEQIKRPTLEALAVARGMADQLGGKLDVLVLGPGGPTHAGELAAHGADRVVTFGG